MARSRLADQVGRVVGGRYRLIAPVGTGASADVYVADDVTLRRRVAVKVLHDALAIDDGFLKRFRAEARAVASLRHPNIMSVFDWGEDSDGPYLVLEYLGGGSLRDMLDGGHRLSLAQAASVGLEAARGLSYAHRRGLIHRDVKPANLLFDDEGRLAIADFGIARALAEATWTEPAGAVVGTARYASPEQARGRSIDGRADVYALALVLVEIVTGSVPFASDTTIATLMARLEEPIPVAPSLGPLAPVVAAAGAVDPADRPEAAALIMLIEDAARDLPDPEPLPLAAVSFPSEAPPEAQTAINPLPAPAIAPPPAPVPVPQPKAARGPRRWAYPWVAIAVIALAVATAVGALAIPALRTHTYLLPDLTGESLDQARAIAKHFTLREHDVREGLPKNVIHHQRPLPGKHKAGTVTVDVSIGFPLVNVPDLTNMTTDEARGALQAVQLALADPVLQGYSDTVAPGHVIKWSPNTQAEQTSAITITISGGPQFVPMPDVTGQSVDVAKSTLRNAGITDAPQVVQQFSDTVPAGEVISTEPAPGQSADRAKSPQLTVSKGPDVVTVPDIVGDHLAGAQAALQSAGLQAAVFGPKDGDIVVATSPPAGQKVHRGSTVYVFVTR